MATSDPVRAARDTTDWPALYREGMRVELGGELSEAVMLVAPYSRERELLVVMVPVPHAMVRTLRTLLAHGAQLVRAAGGLLALMGGRR